MQSQSSLRQEGAAAHLDKLPDEALRQATRLPLISDNPLPLYETLCVAQPNRPKETAIIRGQQGADGATRGATRSRAT
jgi:hypothetical protein